MIPDSIAEHVQPVTESGCWLWGGKVNRDGYGYLHADGRTRLAHRYWWRNLIGEIPAGMCVLHKCDTPSCVNPDHLFLGTQAENMQDMKIKGRASRATKIRGEQCWKTTITEQQAREIFAASGSQREIAARFGITQGSVSLIKSGKNWKHATHDMARI